MFRASSAYRMYIVPGVRSIFGTDRLDCRMRLTLNRFETTVRNVTSIASRVVSRQSASNLCQNERGRQSSGM